MSFQPCQARAAALAIGLALASGAAQAKGTSCTVGSDYDLSLRGERLEFVHEHERTRTVALDSGHLFVGGREASLSAGDRERIARIEHGLRALVPEVKGVALEAVDIAFTALGEVARTLSGDAASVARLDSARRRIEAELHAAPGVDFDDKVIEAVVGELVVEFVPALVGDVVGAALSAAFSGDTARAEELEARAERLERDIERRIEPRAAALEARAQKLCAQVEAIDRIEDELEYRLPGGERLDLLRSGPE